MIASLAKAVQFNSEEVKDCKKKINDLEKHSQLLSKENKELKERTHEHKRYKLWWHLKLKGLAEKSDENIRADIIQLFSRIAPDIGRKKRPTGAGMWSCYSSGGWLRRKYGV